MASNPDRLELMCRAKSRKVTALRKKLSESLRQLFAELPGARARRPQ
jgi:hypothetical protein